MPHSLRFGRFELQARERRLLVDGAPTPVRARALDLLLVLTEHAGQLVTRQALLDRVWPELVVEENNLSVQINALRNILGKDTIETIPGCGYRFTAHIVTSPHPTPLGRDTDLASLGALIDASRLVTVTGAGGSGKTRLAQSLLATPQRPYRHGVTWVELGSVREPQHIPRTIAAALGMPPCDTDPLISLTKAAAHLDMLMVLDNAEHLLDEVARVAGALLGAAPGLRLLVTSQAPLKLAAEHVMRLGALATPPGALPAQQALNYSAVALFAERATAADASFTLNDDNAAAVIGLCRALDGLPLAIELAAARTSTLGVHKLAQMLDQRLHWLTRSHNRQAPARHHSLRAALSWSHSLLGAHEQVVFRRLALLPGTASLDLIQRIVADTEGPLDTWVVLDALCVLVERSFVSGQTADNPTQLHYQLHHSPRAFALAQLVAAKEEPMMRHRLALALPAMAGTARPPQLSSVQLMAPRSKAPASR
jgi:predicted ATPase/DNA-binding winged helix-turn-helix (wHTH) protein